MSAAPTRREALRTAALGAGALAGAGLLRPVAALAQATTDEDLRDFLVPTIALEQIAVYAYDAAIDVNDADAGQQKTFRRFRDQEQRHADALRQALDSLGFDAPDVPESPMDSAVFDDVDGISDERARQLSATLAEIEELSTAADFLDYLVELETQEVGVYAGAAPGLDSEDLATSCAEIAANQAQHIVVLETARDRDPAKILASIASAAKGAGASKESQS